MVFVAGALPPHPYKELSFLDLVHFERYAFKKAKVFGVPFLKKGNKKSLTTQNTKESIILEVCKYFAVGYSHCVCYAYFMM